MKSGLSSKPSEIDEFAHEGHDNTAQILLDVVKTNNDGLMIALEGAWGSGKSSVIEMLKNKAKKKDKTPIKIFCFDSWAHEGDPLRLAFLLSIIDQAEDQAKDKNKLDDKTFKDLKKKITGTEKTTATKQTISSNAKWVAGASLLVPFGLALISLIVEEYDVVVDVDWSVMFVLSCIALITYAVFSKKDRNKAIAFFLSLTLFLSILFYVKFNPSSSFTFFQSNFDIITSALWLGVVLSLAPFLVLLIQIFFKEKREEKESQEEKKKSSGWSFFTSEVTETQAKEFTEGGDKTSIDFEEYFSEILKNIQKPNSNNVKVVFVVDNIDRVSEENALRIWSTLQIFMQKKRENVFFIVPYDPVGLQAMWENIVEDEKPHRASRQIVLNSFLDKSFDLRIEIPLPIHKNWREYTHELIVRDFSDWRSDQKDSALKVLTVTRRSLSDGISPRQIKMYLSHLNIYFKSAKNIYPTDATAYFVYLRYVVSMSLLDICDFLIQGKFRSEKYYNGFKDEVFEGLCGIVYGVEAKEGYEVMIEKVIREKSLDSISLLIPNFYKNYERELWSIFSRHIQKVDNLVEITRSIFILNTVGYDQIFLPKNKVFLDELLAKIDILLSHPELGLPNAEQGIILIASFFSFFSQEQGLYSNMYQQCKDSFRLKILEKSREYYPFKYSGDTPDSPDTELMSFLNAIKENYKHAFEPKIRLGADDAIDRESLRGKNFDTLSEFFEY